MNNNRWILGVTASILALFIVFLALLWKIGLFDFTGSEASSKIVAATIALIAGLFGSLVSLFGILLKHSFDHRNLDLKNQEERRLQLESERNNSLRIEGEKRLKLEAAIQAVQLLSTSSGADIPVTQRAGVLFSLAHLDLLDLALTMLNQMLFDNRIDAETTAWLFDKAIRSNNEATQSNGSVLLGVHVEKLLQEKGSAAFPESVLHNWDTELPLNVRNNIAVALLSLVSSRHYSDWDFSVLNTIVATLVSIFRTEPDSRIRNCVGICLQKILKIYSLGYIIYADTEEILVDEVRAELAELIKDTTPNVLGSLYTPIAKSFEEGWFNTTSGQSKQS